jgi:hypothetical protein
MLCAMHGYQIALFVHLLALLAAFSASGIVHFAMTRLRDARTGADALQWLGLCHRLSRVFPLALLALVGSGAWMTRDAWTWDTGFVDAGLAGAAFLFVSGAVVEGGRARRAAKALAALGGAPLGGRAAELVRDRLWWCASWGNTGTALGVVFAMATKPGAAGAFAAVGTGLAAGACVGLAGSRRAAGVAEPDTA